MPHIVSQHVFTAIPHFRWITHIENYHLHFNMVTSPFDAIAHQLKHLLFCPFSSSEISRDLSMLTRLERLTLSDSAIFPPQLQNLHMVAGSIQLSMLPTGLQHLKTCHLVVGKAQFPINLEYLECQGPLWYCPDLPASLLHLEAKFHDFCPFFPDSLTTLELELTTQHVIDVQLPKNLKHFTFTSEMDDFIVITELPPCLEVLAWLSPVNLPALPESLKELTVHREKPEILTIVLPKNIVKTYLYGVVPQLPLPKSLKWLKIEVIDVQWHPFATLHGGASEFATLNPAPEYYEFVYY